MLGGQSSCNPRASRLSAACITSGFTSWPTHRGHADAVKQPTAVAHGCAGNARSRHRMLAESAREKTDRGGEHGHAERHDGGQRAIIAKHGVRGPPECAVRIGRMCQHPIRLQGGKAGQAVGGKYRGDLQADNEAVPK